MATPIRTPEAGVPAAPRPRRRRRRRAGPRWLDFSIGATALVVSAASLLVARHQAQVMDRQLAASVWPSVRYSYSNLSTAGDPLITFVLDNHGVGPAKLKALRVFYHGRPIENFHKLAAACCAVDSTGFGPPGISLISSYVVGRVAAAGEHIAWLTVRLDTTRLTRPQRRRAARVFGAFNDARPDVAVRLCYCSVLDECWVTNDEAGEPVRISSCDAEQKKLQYQ